MSEKNDRLVDRLLDESLRQYGRVQPRAGLEARLLRRLQDEEQRHAARWKFFRVTPAWGSAAAAAVLIVAVVLTQQPRLHRSSQAGPQAVPQAVPQAGKDKAEQKEQGQVAMVTPQAPAPPAFSGLRGPARQGESSKGMNAARPLGFHLPGAVTRMAGANPAHTLVARDASPSAASMAENAVPKLAQFPAPEPPTRQELALAQVSRLADAATLRALAAASSQEETLQPPMTRVIALEPEASGPETQPH